MYICVNLVSFSPSGNDVDKKQTQSKMNCVQIFFKNVFPHFKSLWIKGSAN